MYATRWASPARVSPESDYKWTRYRREALQRLCSERRSAGFGVWGFGSGSCLLFAAFGSWLLWLCWLALLSAGLDGFAGWPLACLVAADARLGRAVLFWGGVSLRARVRSLWCRLKAAICHTAWRWFKFCGVGAKAWKMWRLLARHVTAFHWSSGRGAIWKTC